MMPKRTKYRKMHRGRRRGMAKGGTKVSFGEYGIKALEEAWITARQIESARVAITTCICGGKYSSKKASASWMLWLWMT